MLLEAIRNLAWPSERINRILGLGFRIFRLVFFWILCLGCPTTTYASHTRPKSVVASPRACTCRFRHPIPRKCLYPTNICRRHLGGNVSGLHTSYIEFKVFGFQGTGYMLECVCACVLLDSVCVCVFTFICCVNLFVVSCVCCVCCVCLVSFVCLFACLFVCLFVRVCVLCCVSFVCLPVCLSACLFVCLCASLHFVCLFVCLSVCLFVSLCVYVCVCMCLFVCLLAWFVCLFVCVCLFVSVWESGGAQGLPGLG